MEQTYNVSDLESLRGYWRGRAQTRREMAALEPVGFEQDRHLAIATRYELIASGFSPVPRAGNRLAT